MYNSIVHPTGVVLSLVVLLVPANSARGQDNQQVTSLEGSWTVTAKLVEGKPENKGMQLFGQLPDEIDSQFVLYANGYGKNRKDDDLWWKYDNNKKTFKFQRYTDFGWPGWVDIANDGRAEKVGDTIKFTYSAKYQDGVTRKVELIMLPTKLATAADRGAVVTLEKTTFDRDDFTEDYETGRGIPKKIALKRSFESTVTMSATVGLEVGGEAKVGSDLVGSVTASIKTKIEASLGATIGTKETYEESYELNGKENTKMTVKWVKRYRKGSIKYADGSTKNFEVFVGFRTIPEYK